MAKIHPSAVVSPESHLGANIEIGPFCVIEPEAQIGNNCRLAARVTIKAGTILGCDNEIGEGAVLGGDAQHLRAGPQAGILQIGNGNIIRENCTIHRALEPGQHTRVGNNNLIMVNAHVGHDCTVGSDLVIANNALLGGHVLVGDRAYIAGAAAVHQFCRIGRLAMLGGQAHVTQDVPPFVMVDGKSNKIVGLNLVGLRRAAMDRDQIEQLKSAYRVIYRSGLTWSETLAELKARFPQGPASEFPPFLAAGSRGFVQERRTPRAATVSFVDTPTTEEKTKKSARKAG